MDFTSALHKIILNLLSTHLYNVFQNPKKSIDTIVRDAIEKTSIHFSKLGIEGISESDLKEILTEKDFKKLEIFFRTPNKQFKINEFAAKFASLSSFHIPNETEKIEKINKIFHFLFEQIEESILNHPQLASKLNYEYNQQQFLALQHQIKMILNGITDLLSQARSDFEKLSIKKEQLCKLQTHEEVKDYLERSVCPLNDFHSYKLFLYRDRFSIDLVDLIKQKKRIIVLADAGKGKSTESKRVAYELQEHDNALCPLHISLNLYTNDLFKLFPDRWEQIPKSRFVLLLDGLDEAVNKSNLFKELLLFSEKSPDSYIVIFCRTNFYSNELDVPQPNNISPSFSSYMLLDLSGTEINKHIKRECKNPGKFNELISQKTLQELLENPFYLINLVNLFNENSTLPTDKSAIFEALIQLRFQHDVKKFKTTKIDLAKRRTLIFGTLEKLAISMGLLGRNYIDEDEYYHIVSDENTREIIEYATLWKQEKSEKETWQFEHNIFQEYLAAKVLSRQTLDTIKRVISFERGYDKIKPTWVNTLSFLTSILHTTNQKLFTQLVNNWILKIEPELLIKFEPDKLPKKMRIHTFKKIFNHYKKKQIRINRDKFPNWELAQFGQSEEIVDFLLDEIEDANDSIVICTAIELLNFMKGTRQQKARFKKNLVDCALKRSFDREYKQIIPNRTLLALTNHNFNKDRSLVNRIVAELVLVQRELDKLSQFISNNMFHIC